jgi:NAD(P)H-hydrate epimerase
MKTINLMENAGKNVEKIVTNELKPKTKKILIFCGVGNNGGDGFVAARYLSRCYNVSVFLVGKKSEIKTDISRENYNKLKNTNVTIYDIKHLNNLEEIILDNELIIDSILGVGLSGNLREPYLNIVENINKSKHKIIISTDVPTGLGTDKAIKPDYTITFHDLKKGMTQKNSGKIKVVDIGIPEKASKYVGPGELKTYYIKPKKESHKGENGRLLIVGGGPYHGAPALASFAAQRTGTDLIYIATPKKAAKSIITYSPLLIKPTRLAKDMAKMSPCLIVKELNDPDNLTLSDNKIIKPLIKKVDALLIGPGLGSNDATKQTIEKIIKIFVQNKKGIVIDADAIKVVGKNYDLIKNKKIVITPHIGEFRELTGVKLKDDLKSRTINVEKWAKTLGITVVLKGPTDIISNGENTKYNDIHNKAMTVGGTGDVLAGIIGALLSKGTRPFNAARIGIFINGLAGNLAFKKRSYGMIATDLIDQIPNVLKKYL